MNKKVCVILAVCCLAGLFGCEAKQDTAGSSTGKSEASAEERIKAIESNPNMPEQAKQAAIAQIRSGPVSGQAAKENVTKK